MRRITKTTIVLPLAVVLAGILVPAILDRVDKSGATPVVAVVKIHGRTARQWAAAARAAAEKGDYIRALHHIKVAERVDEGTQFAVELAAIRKARWRDGEIERVRDRFFRGPVANLAFLDDGSVAGGYRTVVALPGESLWSLSRALVSARLGVLEREVPDKDGAVYEQWDALVDINGLRELEVGERVRLPLREADVAPLEAVNRDDLERIARARDAVGAGDLARADSLLAAVAGTFVPQTDAYRETMALLDEAREVSLVDAARTDIGKIGRLERSKDHEKRLELLADAGTALADAESMSPGMQYADARELVDRLAADEKRYEVQTDGTIVAVKPAGESYTAAARAAVEWLLERSLRTSGQSFPNSALKTDDDRAWARYLMLAEREAESRGIDFAGLLVSENEEVLRLPGPAAVFAD